ncbi:peptidase M48 [Mameliella alba]|uniref:M48 family metallopeptidase n=1 Tax=Mameliella TaxID=1434019 RepID=UPI0008411304|nr:MULTISPECIES: M48 family metallopeptidase [Mameliella]ODM46955.1 peptidase M48 [Ruegeria sp. PBVC088]MDD9730181.1 M48 family metallopeptidase [Mameliella sp. AT18]OWV47858.1 peptidase M48 [Mameliella alba]PTR39752.1 peptidase M48-like protein [Mameliella alba]SDD13442.1 Peptidase family M48 [Mameliella alba]
MTRLLPLIALALLSACAAPLPAPAPSALGGSEAQQRANRAARQFVQVVQTVEPVAERECRERTRGLNCDFQIVIDDRAELAPNAFQTVDRFGRPILAFNIGMINSVRNADELAFVMGHEAAHHILDHLAKTKQSATIGAVVFAGIAAISGAEAEAVRNAEQLGAAVGARTYSKEFELEADQLGTIITYRAGFDPLRGAEFFARIPDPGNRFLGSHPPNAARLKIVAETEKALRQQ